MRELPEMRDCTLDGMEEINKLETIDRCSESDSSDCQEIQTKGMPSVDSQDRLDEKCLPFYTLSEVSDHNSPNDCWIVVRDRIYDVTKFLKSHPGGDEIIMENAGTDATFSFRGVGHSDEAKEEMEKYCIGVLIESERLNLHIWRSSSILSTLSMK